MEKDWFGCGPTIEKKSDKGVEKIYLWSCLTNKDFLTESENQRIFKEAHQSLIRLVEKLNQSSSN